MAPTSALAIVSDHLEGTRLSDILRVAQEKQLQLDINAALCLIRQLVPAVAVLHENARDVAHGLIAPERLVVTPNARLVIVEHVLGAAIEQLQFGRDRLWQEFRVAMPPSAGLPRFDHRADVTGMGLVSLALILGRPLAADEYPHRIPDLLNEARERSALGEEQPLSQPLRAWLARALQIDVRRSFASAPEAMAALDEVLSRRGDVTSRRRWRSRRSCRGISPRCSTRRRYVPAPVEPVVRLGRATRAAGRCQAAAHVETAKPVEREIESRIRRRRVAARAQRHPVPTRSAPEATLHPTGTRELTDLLGTDPLPPAADPARSRPPKSLFNPDAPFTAAPMARSAARTEPSSVCAASRSLRGRARGRLLRWRGACVTESTGQLHRRPPMGSLNVQSNPTGVEFSSTVWRRAARPHGWPLAPGSHILELRGKACRVSFP